MKQCVVNWTNRLRSCIEDEKLFIADNSNDWNHVMLTYLAIFLLVPQQTNEYADLCEGIIKCAEDHTLNLITLCENKKASFEPIQNLLTTYFATDIKRMHKNVPRLHLRNEMPWVFLCYQLAKNRVDPNRMEVVQKFLMPPPPSLSKEEVQNKRRKKNVNEKKN